MKGTRHERERASYTEGRRRARVVAVGWQEGKRQTTRRLSEGTPAPGPIAANERERPADPGALAMTELRRVIRLLLTGALVVVLYVAALQAVWLPLLHSKGF